MLILSSHHLYAFPTLKVFPILFIVFTSATSTYKSLNDLALLSLTIQQHLVNFLQIVLDIVLRHRTGHNKLDLQSVNYDNQSDCFQICIFIRGSPCWQEWKPRTDCNLASPFSSKNWAGRLSAGERKGLTVGQLNRIPGGSLSGRWGTIWLT